MQFGTARSGEPYAHLNGRCIHSRYSPHNEAERYFSQRAPGSPPALLLLLEPGCGYLTEIAARHFPHSRLLELHCRPEFSYRARESGRALVWTPQHHRSLRSFLRETVGDHELANLHILEWEPAKRIFQDEYREMSGTIFAFIRERSASLTTEGKFGPRWLRNMAVNLYRLPALRAPAVGSAAVVIAAPGPSLQRSLETLRLQRGRFHLLALASALEPLLSAGIFPDSVIHTDPGYWAAHHLSAIADTPETTGIFPLTARPYPNTAETGSRQPASSLLISTGSAVEEFLLGAIGAPYLSIPAHGSVSGSALHAAAALTKGPIVFVGLDLSFDDIRSHARGHSFDRILLASAHRLSPVSTVYYLRSARSGTETGRAANRALTAYAEWFAHLPRTLQTYTLGPSPSPHSSSLTPEDFASLLPSAPPAPLFTSPQEEKTAFRPHYAGRDTADRALTALQEKVSQELEELDSASAPPSSRRIGQFPVTESFLALSDRSALLQLRRREGLGATTEEVWQELLRSARGTLEHLRKAKGEP